MGDEAELLVPLGVSGKWTSLQVTWVGVERVPEAYGGVGQKYRPR